MGPWFADHEREWRVGEAYRFAVDLEGRIIGMVDIDGISEREGTLGYWLDLAAWGRGYAFEAADAVTRFAFEDLGLTRLSSCTCGPVAPSNPNMVPIGSRAVLPR